MAAWSLGGECIHVRGRCLASRDCAVCNDPSIIGNGGYTPNPTLLSHRNLYLLSQTIGWRSKPQQREKTLLHTHTHTHTLRSTESGMGEGEKHHYFLRIISVKSMTFALFCCFNLFAHQRNHLPYSSIRHHWHEPALLNLSSVCCIELAGERGKLIFVNISDFNQILFSFWLLCVKENCRISCLLQFPSMERYGTSWKVNHIYLLYHIISSEAGFCLLRIIFPYLGYFTLLIIYSVIIQSNIQI